MKKTIFFLIGFFMLFWLPADSQGVILYFLLWLPISVLLLAYSGAFDSLRKYSKCKKGNYLYQYFTTYPHRAVTANELFEAMKPIPVKRKQLSVMITDAVNEGWLTQNDKYYFLTKTL